MVGRRFKCMVGVRFECAVGCRFGCRFGCGLGRMVGHRLGCVRVAGLVSMRAPLPAISGIRGLEGLVARISGYSSGIGICLTELWIARGKGRI